MTKKQHSSPPEEQEQARPKPLRESPAIAYSVVVSKAQLGGIRLVNSSFNVEKEFFGQACELKINRHIETAPLTVTGESVARFAWTTNATRDGKTLLAVKATFEVTHQNLTGCDEHAVRLFVERVGTMACYPYFRGMVAQFDWAAFTHLPPMPIITSATAFGNAAVLTEEEE